jgi:hypothetical protein
MNTTIAGINMAEMMLRRIMAKRATKIDFAVTFIYHSMTHKLHP